jgi:hypothetical protein
MVAGLAVGLVGVASAGFAQETVQDFDGWKITIRPGASRIPDRIPAAPKPASAEAAPTQGAMKLASFRADLVPPPPAPAKEGDVGEDDHGFPVITPAESSWCCDTRPTVQPPEGTVDPRYMSQMYLEIYKSIPFIRAEYDANPSYIHDTAVEFLFGKMRPTVIHRGTVNVNHNYPNGGDSPYGFGGYGYGGRFGYAYPPLQLVVPGTGLRIHRLN